MDDPAPDLEVIAALRRGDERAFAALVAAHQPAFLRIARAWVRDAASAAEVVQETWLGALQGLQRFQGRSSLRTWLYGILVNVARNHVRAHGRMVPMSALCDQETAGAEPAVEPERFLPPGHQWQGHWAAMPAPFPDPDRALERRELRALLESAIASLPAIQQQVIVLCDVEGLSYEEVERRYPSHESVSSYTPLYGNGESEAELHRRAGGVSRRGDILDTITRVFIPFGLKGMYLAATKFLIEPFCYWP